MESFVSADPLGPDRASVVRFHSATPPTLEPLIRRADRAAIRLIPEWARHFNATEDDPSRELMRTIRVFADCSFNVKLTAQRLSVHTNTVYFRLYRVKKLTGIDPRTYFRDVTFFDNPATAGDSRRHEWLQISSLRGKLGPA